MTEDRVQRTLGAPFRHLRRIEHESMTRIIVRESLRVVILSSIISSVGGLGLELLREKLLVFLPLLILFPALNEMTGGLGAVMVSRLTSAWYAKKIKGGWKSAVVQGLFRDVLGVTVITSVFIGCVAYAIGWVRGFPFHWVLFSQTVGFSLFVGVLLFGVLFCVSLYGSRFVFRRGHNPENYLIPLVTAIGDLGSMALLAVALYWVF